VNGGPALFGRVFVGEETDGDEGLDVQVACMFACCVGSGEGMLCQLSAGGNGTCGGCWAEKGICDGPPSSLA